MGNSNDKGKCNMFYGASPILFELAKELRSRPTKAEEHLWHFLAHNPQGIRFKRQHPILFFIADFYCHQARLVIEIDGGYHRLPEQYQYDQSRDRELMELGLEVMRFTNRQALDETEQTYHAIMDEANRRISSKDINRI